MLNLNAHPFDTKEEKQTWYQKLHGECSQQNDLHLEKYQEGKIAWNSGLCPDECPYLNISAMQSNNMNLISWMKGWSDASRADLDYSEYDRVFSFNGG